MPGLPDMARFLGRVATVAGCPIPPICRFPGFGGGDLVDGASPEARSSVMVQFDSAQLAARCRRHGIRRLRVFGSVARGDDRPGSDVDLIAEFESSVGYFELLSAEEDLADFFGRPVDLLTEPAVSRFIRDEVLGSARVIFENAA